MHVVYDLYSNDGDTTIVYNVHKFFPYCHASQEHSSNAILTKSLCIHETISTQTCWKSPKRKEERVKVNIREDLTYKTNFVFWIKVFVLTSNKLVLIERSEKASISTEQDAMKEKHIKKNSKSRSKKKSE